MPSELSEFHFKDLQCQKSLYMSSNFIPTKLMSQTNCSFWNHASSMQHLCNNREKCESTMSLFSHTSFVYSIFLIKKLTLSLHVLESFGSTSISLHFTACPGKINPHHWQKKLYKVFDSIIQSYKEEHYRWLNIPFWINKYWKVV